MFKHNCKLVVDFERLLELDKVGVEAFQKALIRPGIEDLELTRWLAFKAAYTEIKDTLLEGLGLLDGETPPWAIESTIEHLAYCIAGNIHYCKSLAYGNQAYVYEFSELGENKFYSRDEVEGSGLERPFDKI